MEPKRRYVHKLTCGTYTEIDPVVKLLGCQTGKLFLVPDSIDVACIFFAATIASYAC